MTQFYLRVRVIPVRVSLCLGIVCVCVFCVWVNKVCVCVSFLITYPRLYSCLVVCARHDSCIAPISPNVENNTAHFLANTVPQCIWGNLWQLMFYRYIIELWLYLFRGAKIFKTFFCAKKDAFIPNQNLSQKMSQSHWGTAAEVFLWEHLLIFSNGGDFKSNVL